MTISSKGPQCWECLRRDSPCDGKTPICGNCSSAGMVCPGFTNNRPLTWLRTGMVSRIPKKGKPAARPSATAAARDSRRRSIPSSSSAATATATATASPKPKASTPPRSRMRKKAANTSDRGSDAGTPSGASSSGCSSGDSPPGSTTTTTTIVNKAAQSRDGDEDEDGGSSQSAGGPRHQLVACRNRSGNSPVDGAMQIHVTAIPPDLRPQDWDYIDAIKMCKFDFSMLSISTLQISTLSGFLGYSVSHILYRYAMRSLAPTSQGTYAYILNWLLFMSNRSALQTTINCCQDFAHGRLYRIPLGSSN